MTSILKTIIGVILSMSAFVKCAILAIVLFVGFFYVSPPKEVSAKPLVGAHFFYWFDCLPPNNYAGSICDEQLIQNMPYKPSSISIYSARNVEWYKSEFADMANAGINYVIPVSWGSRHPTATWFRDSSAIPLMVQAITEGRYPLKIALLDDTNSEVSEWNMDNGRGYTNPTEHPENPDLYKMPLDDANWKYFYDFKIKPFFNSIPQDLWATHNGESVENGGRPLIIVYDAYRSFTKLENSDEMWYAIKNAFEVDFSGVSPFVILDYSWFYPYNLEEGRLQEFVDGKFIWTGGNDAVAKKYTLNGYTTASIDPGFTCPTDYTGYMYVNCEGRPRNLSYPERVLGNEDSRLVSMYNSQVDSATNLLLIETWNELREGTSIARSTTYPGNDGKALPSRYYLESLRNLLDYRNTADANNDGLVDGKDYVYWLLGYSRSLTTGTDGGDYNHDGKVDGKDYVIWLINYYRPF